MLKLGGRINSILAVAQILTLASCGICDHYIF